MNTDEFGNPLQGEPNDTVGQDETVNAQENSDNWQEQAICYQSEKDKLQAENVRLKEYQEIGQFLESRPDIVKKIVSETGDGGQPKKITLNKDEFDPWEAYNDPSSKSYQFRQQELQDSINDAVKSQVAGVQKQVGMNQLQNELSNRGMTGEQIQSFMDFASKNPADYGIDGAINMWQSVTQKPTESNESVESPLDAIRQNQAVPQQGGVLNGQQPVKQDEAQTMWESIMSAGSRAKVL
jgi:hypothetical protein